MASAKLPVSITPIARESIRDISSRLARFSPTAAARFRRRITYRLRLLENDPESGRMVPEYGVKSIREVIEGEYREWYRLRDDRIEILAVIHGARQILDR